jgi:hypothetical protein
LELNEYDNEDIGKALETLQNDLLKNTKKDFEKLTSMIIDEANSLKKEFGIEK